MMGNRTELVAVTMRAEQIAQAANLVYWLSSPGYAGDAAHVEYHERDMHEKFADLAEILGYRVEKIEEHVQPEQVEPDCALHA